MKAQLVTVRYCSIIESDTVNKIVPIPIASPTEKSPSPCQFSHLLPDPHHQPHPTPESEVLTNLPLT